jgi:hypothetical protein
MRLTNCPECGAVAEVVDEGRLASTDGLLRHVRVLCLNRHWFLMLDRFADDQVPDRNRSERATSP